MIMVHSSSCLIWSAGCDRCDVQVASIIMGGEDDFEADTPLMEAVNGVENGRMGTSQGRVVIKPTKRA